VPLHTWIWGSAGALLRLEARNDLLRTIFQVPLKYVNKQSEKAGLTAFSCQRTHSPTLLRERGSYGRSS
jgi:hypothetical protein